LSQQSSSPVRFLAAVLLLVGTGLFLHSRSQPERLPPHEALTSFPDRIGDWQGTELTISPNIRQVLGEGDFTVRVYGRRPDEPQVDLFLAFFPSQRMGSTMHSPQNCLPGAGWLPVEASRIKLLRPDGKTITVNRYIIGKGLERRLVLYWYQAHGRVVASEYWAKFYLVADAIRMNRSDGALVRITTPIVGSESQASAEQRCAAFVEDLLPILGKYIPQ
jgi:EpsI family protein